MNVMLYVLSKGTFKEKAGNLDGDTVRFAPDNPSLLSDLPRRWERPYVRHTDGTIPIRYQGIDTLEKDAIKPFASNATCRNRKLLGLHEADERRGYILTHLIGPYGRPIVFVFTGCPSEEDGTWLSLSVDKMKESVNFCLIQEGQAYPTFYTTLEDEFREAIKTATINARNDQKELWAHDRTRDGVTLNKGDKLSNLYPIFPKLWRRLKNYRRDERYPTDDIKLDTFKGYLEKSREKVLIISESRVTHFHDIVQVEGNKISLLYNPEDLIFI